MNNHNFLSQSVCLGVKKDTIIIVEYKIISDYNQCYVAVVGVGMGCAFTGGLTQTKE